MFCTLDRVTIAKMRIHMTTRKSRPGVVHRWRSPRLPQIDLSALIRAYMRSGPPLFQQIGDIVRLCQGRKNALENKESPTAWVQLVRTVRATFTPNPRGLNLHIPTAHSAEWSSRMYGGSGLSSPRLLLFWHSDFPRPSACGGQ
jgi:hypothetical protein